jgi:hypothetical protein
MSSGNRGPRAGPSRKRARDVEDEIPSSSGIDPRSSREFKVIGEFTTTVLIEVYSTSLFTATDAPSDPRA